MNTPQTGEIWQHYKTKGEYEIIDTGKLQTKQEDLDMKEAVVYRALQDKTVWVRPLEDFTETVRNEAGESVPRFHRLR